MALSRRWHHWRGTDGRRHRPCRGARRLQCPALRHFGRTDREGHRHRQRQHGPAGRPRKARRMRARRRRLARISAAPAIEDLAGADLVIEAATEDESVKRKIYSQLCPQLNPEAILATNTSSISITRLAAADRPARALHRHSLHEPGAGDEAGRARARHRHRRPRPSRRPRNSSASSTRRSRSRRISRPSSSTASCCR